MDAQHLKISIITCAYNPNKEIFLRLISSIGRLAIGDFEAEWIVVDNNSAQSIANTFDFRNVEMPVRHVIEKKPGLTNARIAGAKKAKGSWLVFFDDDNEPKPNYIANLVKGIKQYPKINCWGPGHIEVEYIGQVKPWFLENKNYFQEIKGKTQFGSEKRMQPYHPIGTGLCIEKKSILDYVEKVETGLYSVMDRTGKSLVSGGDTQIVLNNQVIGGVAGKLETLSLNHLIEARKANFKYLKQQKFWTAASYHLVLQQVYTNTLSDKQLKFKLYDVFILMKKFYHDIKVKRQDFYNARLNFCGYLGEYYAPYFAQKKKTNLLFRTIKKLIVD